MIVDLRPYQYPDDFERHYGIDVSGFSKLIKEGYIVPHYGSDFKRYIGKKYLLPIFNSSMHQYFTLRTDFIFDLLDPKYKAYSHSIMNDIEKILLNIWEKSDKQARAYFMNDWDAFLTSWSKRLSRVMCMSPEMGNIIFSYRTRKDFLYLVNMYVTILTFPITKALCGTYKMSFDNYELIKRSL